MGRAQYGTASDGLSARVAHDWTEEKLRILECYIHGFAIACKRAPAWVALDLFAGGGLNVSAMSGQDIPGSVKRLLDAGPPRASLVVASEKDPEVCGVLERRLSSYGNRARVLCVDGVDRIDDLLRHIDPRLPAFAFLDPEGTELDWNAVAAIANHKPGPWRIEQLILLPTDLGFTRLLSPAFGDRYAHKLTRMFGHERWREIAEARELREIDAETARMRYVDLYVEGLRQLGYASVQPRRIFRARGGQPMYFLIFATGHAAGQRIMANCFDKVHVDPMEPARQETLFTEVGRLSRRRSS